MFEELSRVVENGKSDHSFRESIEQNVIGKASKSGLVKTRQYLLKLYAFDAEDPAFAHFLHFWEKAAEAERRLLALTMLPSPLS